MTVKDSKIKKRISNVLYFLPESVCQSSTWFLMFFSDNQQLSFLTCKEQNELPQGSLDPPMEGLEPAIAGIGSSDEFTLAVCYQKGARQPSKKICFLSI